MENNTKINTVSNIALLISTIILIFFVGTGVSIGQDNGNKSETRPESQKMMDSAGSTAGSPIEQQRQKLPQRSGEKEASQVPRHGLAGAMFSLLGSLILVLGAFLIVIYIIRKITPRTTGTLPKNILEKMGEYRLTSRHRLHLVKFSDRFLLLSVCGEEVRTLSEITNINEVKQLARHLKTLTLTDYPMATADPLPPTETLIPKGERS